MFSILYESGYKVEPRTALNKQRFYILFSNFKRKGLGSGSLKLIVKVSSGGGKQQSFKLKLNKTKSKLLGVYLT